MNKRFSRTGSFSSANSLLFLYLIIKNLKKTKKKTTRHHQLDRKLGILSLSLETLVNMSPLFKAAYINTDIYTNEPSASCTRITSLWISITISNFKVVVFLLLLLLYVLVSYSSLRGTNAQN